MNASQALPSLTSGQQLTSFVRLQRKLSNKTERYWRCLGTLATVLIFAVSASVHADDKTSAEPYNTGWSVQVDNDLLAGGQKDQDYTGGFAVTLSGSRVKHYKFTPEKARQKLDRFLGLDGFFNQQDHHHVHALEFGAALFTPSDISRPDLNRQDRPYASLFFLNSSQQTVIPKRKLSIKSGLTIGILGLDLAESLQTGIHSVVGGVKPQGWRHQISDGGELTAKYSISSQQALYQSVYRNGLAQEINWTSKIDLGYTTGVGVGFNWRFGKINTPWWSFNPHQSEYINLGANIATGARGMLRKQERYVYAGGTLNYSAYNAFLQGQFRSSEAAADRSVVNPRSAEIWGGITSDIGKQLRADLFIRSRTKDLELPESKALSWGGFTLSRVF